MPRTTIRLTGLGTEWGKMPYIIYGKRPDDKRFKPLDWRGHQVNKLADAFTYAEKSDAQDILDKYNKSSNIFEIRKAK